MIEDGEAEATIGLAARVLAEIQHRIAEETKVEQDGGSETESVDLEGMTE